MEQILIVEDEPEIRTVLEAMVQKTGYRTLVAADAAEADNHLGSDLALIFVDLSLPEKTGLDWIRELRRSPSHQKVPVVVVTARPDGQEQIDAAALDNVHLINKPFRLKQVRGIIASLLGGGS